MIQRPLKSYELLGFDDKHPHGSNRRRATSYAPPYGRDVGPRVIVQAGTSSTNGRMPPQRPSSQTKAQAKAQGDHREGKSSAGLKTGKNPGLKASHTSGANKQD